MNHLILEYTPWQPTPRRQLTVLATFDDAVLAEQAQRVLGLRHPNRYFMLVPEEKPEEGDGEVTPPPPVLSSLSPNTAVLGSPSFTLHVIGEGFTPESVISWNNAPEPTTFVSETELTTGVNMETATTAADIPVTVATPGALARGVQSNVLLFTFTEPAAPVLTTLTPDWCRPAATAFTLSVQGTGFPATSVICFDGVEQPTVWVSDSELTTLFDPDYPANPAFTIQVTVKGAPTYQNVSNALPLLVTSDPPLEQQRTVKSKRG